jgi:hypothetical protein
MLARAPISPRGVSFMPSARDLKLVTSLSLAATGPISSAICTLTLRRDDHRIPSPSATRAALERWCEIVTDSYKEFGSGRTAALKASLRYDTLNSRMCYSSAGTRGGMIRGCNAAFRYTSTATHGGVQQQS